MLRTLSAIGVSLGVLLTASLAHAQANTAHNFGQQGEFIFSADRLMPLFAYTNQKTDVPTGDPAISSQTVTQNQTNLSFFWGSTFPNELFYTTPRVGFDYTIVDNVTIGGDLILYFTLGGSTNTHTDFKDGHTTDTSTSAPGYTMFGFAPRGGYILGLSDLFALWLRGGFSYYNGTSKQDINDANGNKIGTQSDTHWVFALDLDPQFVIVPTEHFAFTVGPAIDIPLTGKFTREASGGGTTQSTSVNYSQFGFAINAGLMGWFGG
jgi:hypothetical protein